MTNRLAAIAVARMCAPTELRTAAFSGAVFSDDRRVVSGDLHASRWREWETSGGGWGVGTSLTARPSGRLRLTVGPDWSRSQDPWSYVAQPSEGGGAGATHYVFANLTTWGWFTAILGALQLVAAVGVLAANQMFRWFAVIVIVLNAIDQMFFIPAYPFWSLTIIAMDVVALWGLCAYGSRQNIEAAA